LFIEVDELGSGFMQKRLMLCDGEAALAALGGVSRHDFATSSRFDIAPGQWVGAVWNDASGERIYGGFRWGIAPAFWDESHHAGHLLFSARAETLPQRAAFAQALQFRRALVPVDGFWMWSRPRAGVGEKPRPFLFRLQRGEPMFIAALWEEATDGERRLALVSVESNHLTEPFGARMPALLRLPDAQTWLERGIVDSKASGRLLRTPSARELLVVPATLWLWSMEQTSRPRSPSFRRGAAWLGATTKSGAMSSFKPARFRATTPRAGTRLWTSNAATSFAIALISAIATSATTPTSGLPTGGANTSNAPSRI